MVAFELPKFRAQNRTLNDVKADPLKRWLYLFEEGYKDEREMEALTDMTEERTETIRAMIANGLPLEVAYKSINAPRSEIDMPVDKLRKETRI